MEMIKLYDKQMHTCKTKSHGQCNNFFIRRSVWYQMHFTQLKIYFAHAKTDKIQVSHKQPLRLHKLLYNQMITLLLNLFLRRERVEFCLSLENWMPLFFRNPSLHFQSIAGKGMRWLGNWKISQIRRKKHYR